MTEGCVFCDHDRLREADLYFENDFCIYSSTRDPRDPPDVIPGCALPHERAAPADRVGESFGHQHVNGMAHRAHGQAGLLH